MHLLQTGQHLFALCRLGLQLLQPALQARSERGGRLVELMRGLRQLRRLWRLRRLWVRLGMLVPLLLKLPHCVVALLGQLCHELEATLP